MVAWMRMRMRVGEGFKIDTYPYPHPPTHHNQAFTHRDRHDSYITTDVTDTFLASSSQPITDKATKKQVVLRDLYATQ